MARVSTDDPIEKFRFKIIVLSVDLSVTGGIDALAAAATQTFGGGLTKNIGKTLSLISRAGFSEVTLPKLNINEVSYRENIDNNRFSKSPGLITYEPVTLKRGVTSSRNLYDWYRLIQDDTAFMSTARELTSSKNFTVGQTDKFRKEVIIEVYNRAGEITKRWILFNAWPISYKGGDDLSASDDSSKLVEEITLTYEFFLELEGGTMGFVKDAIESAVTHIADGGFKIPFIG